MILMLLAGVMTAMALAGCSTVDDDQGSVASEQSAETAGANAAVTWSEILRSGL